MRIAGLTEYEWREQQTAEYLGPSWVALLQDLARLREHLERLARRLDEMSAESEAKHEAFEREFQHLLERNRDVPLRWPVPDGVYRD